MQSRFTDRATDHSRCRRRLGRYFCPSPVEPVTRPRLRDCSIRVCSALAVVGFADNVAPLLFGNRNREIEATAATSLSC